VELVPLAAGARVPLRAVRGLVLSPFAVQHRGESPCFGYRVLQTRWRLRQEARGLSTAEVGQRVQKDGRAAVAECVEVPLLVVSGDSTPLPPSIVHGAELLVHESTFVGAQIEPSHSTLEDVVATWRASGARRLLVYHFSPRYRADEIAARLAELVPDAEERGRVWCVPPGVLFDEDLPMAGL